MGTKVALSGVWRRKLPACEWLLYCEAASVKGNGVALANCEYSPSLIDSALARLNAPI